MYARYEQRRRRGFEWGVGGASRNVESYPNVDVQLGKFNKSCNPGWKYATRIQRCVPDRFGFRYSAQITKRGNDNAVWRNTLKERQ